MRQEHIKAILEGIVPVVKDAIAAAQKPLLDRIDVLERRGIEKGEPGAAGIDGKDGASVSMDDVTPVLAEMVEKAVAALPAPKAGADGNAGRDGIDGKDGASVSMDDVAPVLAEMVERAVAAIPAPKDGAAGAPGRDGEPGKDGASVSMADVTPVLAAMVERAVAELPPPVKGEPGEPGQRGEPGRDGRDASDIPMLKGFIGEEMRMQLGQAMQSFAVTSPDDGRTLSFSFDVAGESVQREIKTSLVLDRGVWKSGPFAKGDGVSFGGSFFIAQLDTEDKPETSGAWRLAVKRGRDGRDGKNGEQGPVGPKGDKGELGPRGFPSA